MFSKKFYATSFGLSVLLLSSSLSAASQGENWYGYCWTEKNHSRICKAPEARDDDFNIKCRDFATEVQGSRWGSRYSTNMASLEADMGEQCDEVWQQQGKLYTCNLAITCPDNSSETTGLHSFGNRVYATDAGKAVERCSDLNEHRVLGSIKRYSKADCSLRLLPQVLENQEQGS